MATSRNLTYLGSPFKQGEGKATVVDTTPVASAFLKGMEGVNKRIEEKNKEVQKEKIAQAKSVEDYKLDYFIGHQSYFQGKLDDIRRKGVELLMKGYDLRDYRNKEVAEWQASKINLESQAKLSTQIGERLNKVLDMDAANQAKFKTDSIKDVLAYTQLPLDQQIKGFQNGTMASLQVLNKIPMAELDKFATQINKGIPSLSMLSQDELDQRQMADQKRMRDLVYQMVTPDMIDSTDPKVIEERINSIADEYTNLINKSYEDLKSKMEFEQKQKFHDDNVALRKRELALREKQFNWTKEQAEQAQRAIENYPEFINGIVEGNLDNIRTMEDLLTVTYGSGDNKKIVKPTITIVEIPETLPGTNIPGHLLADGGGYTYVDIKYNNKDKEAGNLTQDRRIKIKNADGTINQEGVDELSGIGRLSFRSKSTLTGVTKPKEGTILSNKKESSLSGGGSSNTKPAIQTTMKGGNER